MERETKTITTPIGKHKVVLKAWITGREKRELRNVFLKNVKDVSGKEEPEKMLTSAEIINEAENKAIETVVVSVDGETKNVLDKILDMRAKDFEFIIEEINKITRDSDFLE